MRMNSSRFTDAFGRNDHLQAVAALFVDSTIVGNPGTLKGTFERVSTKHVAHEIQESAPFASPDFRAVIAMGRDARDDKHWVLFGGTACAMAPLLMIPHSVP
jgi:hypothetical protein